MAQSNNLAEEWGKLNPQQRQMALGRMTADQKSQLASALGFAGSGAVTNKGTKPDRSVDLVKWGLEKLPQVGGMAGGVIGALAGAETGPGAVATSMLGAGAGGTLGEDIRQTAEEHLYPEQPKMGPLESGLRLSLAGGEQAGNELLGQVGGRVAGRVMRGAGRLVPEAAFAKYPILKSVFAVGEGRSPRAVQHLTAAAATRQQAGVTLEAVTNTIGDLEQEMTKLPASGRNVEGFLKAVNARKDQMNLESGTAMLPIAGQKTIPRGSVDNIRKLVRSYMQDTQAGKLMRKYILKRAAELEHPMTYRALDEMRSDLASQLAKHNAKNPVAKYTSEKGDIDLAIDNAILDGLRDTVYPEMDRAAGRPPGYFEDLKGRQSSLITLQEVLDKRIKDLKGAQAISEVAPRFSSENISGSLHPGTMPRVGFYGIRQVLAPTREMKAASSHVAKAFPAIDSLPYQILFSGGVRAAEEAANLPRTRELLRFRDEQFQPAQ